MIDAAKDSTARSLRPGVTFHPCVIVGAGPAGAQAAALLAQAGRPVLLIDEKGPWEKPCGGGVTDKALQLYPFLQEGQSVCNRIDDCELISPAGRRVLFPLNRAIAIYARKTLNGLLLQRALDAGTEFVRSRAIRLEPAGAAWALTLQNGLVLRTECLVLAAGARNPFRAQLLPGWTGDDLMATVGYYIPGRSTRMQIRFLPDVEGYIWTFPRTDHFSAGICGRMGATPTLELRRRLEQFLDDEGYGWQGAPVYGHVLPGLRRESLRTLQVAGPGWYLAGDAAGLVDPITGEGLFYALRSGELLAQALIAGRPERYSASVAAEIVPELERAARVCDRFYHGRLLGAANLERMIQLTGRSRRFRHILCDLVAGSQGYQGLRHRVLRSLVPIAFEVLAG